MNTAVAVTLNQTGNPTIYRVIKNFIVDMILARGKVAKILWSLADQAIVSAANFLVLFYIARRASSSDVGIYAIAISIVVILISVQDALITKPYTVKFFDSGLRKDQLAGGALSLTLLLSALASIAALAFSYTHPLESDRLNFTSLVAVFSFVIPFALLREFVRRYLLATVSLRELFFFDLFCILLLFCSMYYLSQTEHLNVVTALGAMGFAYSVGFAGWFCARFRRFSIGMDHTRKTGVIFWEFGKWLLPTKAIRELQGYMTHWFSIVLLSASATGVFAANLSVLALSNPFVIGLLNIMTPRAVRAHNERGMAGLRDQTIINVLILSVMMFGFCIFIFLFGETAMNILFPGDDYHQNNTMLLILAVAVAIASAAGPISISLVCAGYAKEESKISFYICAISLVIIPALITHSGLTGAALAVLLIESLGFIARLILLTTAFHAAGVRFDSTVVLDQIARRLAYANTGKRHAGE